MHYPPGIHGPDLLDTTSLLQRARHGLYVQKRLHKSAQEWPNGVGLMVGGLPLPVGWLEFAARKGQRPLYTSSRLRLHNLQPW